MLKTLFYIQIKSLVNVHFVLELWESYKKYSSEYKAFDFSISIAISGKNDEKGSLPTTLFSVIVEDDTNIQELFVEKWEEWCKLNGSQKITSIDLFLFAYPKEKEKLDQFAKLFDFYHDYCSGITVKLAKKPEYIPIQLIWYRVVKRMLVIKVYQQEIYEWFRKVFYI
jgi:hypothetical protein